MIKVEVSIDCDTIYFGEFRIEDDTDTQDVYLNDKYQDFFYNLEDAIKFCLEQSK